MSVDRSAEVLRLRDGLTSAAFDSSSREREYVVSLPEGGHFRLTARLQELLSCIDGRRTVAEVAAELSALWRARVTPEQVWLLAQQYLAPHGLLQAYEPAPRERRASHPFAWHRPLFGERLIAPITSVGRRLFAPPVAVLALSLVAWLHWQAYARGDVALVHFAQALGDGTFLLVYGLVLLSVLAHEFGHASACRAFGERYGDIGVALYLIFPAFYADVSRIWRLGRWQRLVVDLGGVYFQLLASALYAAAYLLTGQVLFLLAVAQIGLLVLFTLNPFGRFDGYWVLCDLLGVTNLWRELRGLARRLRTGERNSSLRPAQQAVLVLYCVAVVGALGTFALNLVTHAPQHGARFMQAVGASLHGIRLGWQAADALAVLAGLVRLIAPVALVLGTALFMRQTLARIVRRERGDAARQGLAPGHGAA